MKCQFPLITRLAFCFQVKGNLLESIWNPLHLAHANSSRLSFKYMWNKITASKWAPILKPNLQEENFSFVSVTFDSLPWLSLGLHRIARRCPQEGNSRVSERSGLHTAASATRTAGNNWGGAGGFLGSRWWDSSPSEGSSSHWSIQWDSSRHWLHQT